MRDLIARVVPSGDISQRSVASGIWAGFGNVSTRGLQLIKLVIIANFLPPSEFGLMGIALLATSAFQRFLTLGLDQALIHHDAVDVDTYLDSVWSVKIIRGLLILLVGWFAAPILGDFFRAERAVPLIRALAVSPLLVSFANPAIVYFQKDLAFHLEFIYRFSGALLNVASAIAAAYLLGTVWALVIGNITGKVVQLIVSYLIRDYRPSFEIRLDLLSDLIGYSKWVTVSNPLTFIIGEGDDAFVAWFLGASSLGLYQISYRFSNSPATEITSVLDKVMFPAIARTRNERERAVKWYRHMLTLTAVVTIPMATGIALVAPAFVYSLLGMEWENAIPVIQVLAFFGAVRSITAVDGSVVRALGRPDISTKTHVLTLFLMILTLFPLSSHLGLIGTSIAVSASLLIASVPRTYAATQLVGLPKRNWLIAVIHPLVASGGMAIAVLTISIFVETTALVTLLFQVITGIIVYVGFTVLLARLTNYNVFTIIEQMLHTMESPNES